MEISASLLNVEYNSNENNEALYRDTFGRLELARVDYFHIDVMDGEFVEKNTVDKMIAFASTIKMISSIPLDVHIMCKDIKSHVDIFSDYEPRIITFQYEADKEHVLENINYIKEKGIMVGLAINPDTKVEEIKEFLPYIHNVLVMDVFAGKGGQSFIEETPEKIKELKDYITENNIDISIEVDGGINYDTAEKVSEAGADIAVVGTFLINAIDYKYTVEELKRK